VFSPLRAPPVRSALLDVVFCLDFGPFFFLLLFPCIVFFLYLFIYLFRIIVKGEAMKIMNLLSISLQKAPFYGKFLVLIAESLYFANNLKKYAK
jgi:hypothetical protein